MSKEFPHPRPSNPFALAECGAVARIGNVRNIAAVFLAIENVDVVVFHSSPPKDRLCPSTRASKYLTWWAIMIRMLSIAGMTK
jgi:hypothetical protein